MAANTPTHPDSLLRVGQVASRAGVTADTIRYYESLGLLEPVTRSPGGYRLFEPSVTDRLAFIRKAQVLGLTLDEVAEVLGASLDGSEPCEHVKSMLRDRLRDIDERLQDLRALRHTVVRALERPVKRADGDSCVCGIIESQQLVVRDSSPLAGGSQLGPTKRREP